jgi:hypothetical protein
MRAEAESLISLDRPAEAVPIIRQAAPLWEKLDRQDPPGFYEAAKFRAVAASAVRAADKSPAAVREADSDAERATTLLKAAVAVGFKDAAKLQQDPDFDSLRDRDDFKKLVQGLEQKSGNQAK